MSTVDPYGLVRHMVESYLPEQGVSGPWTARQMGEAAVFAAGMLAALGAEPTVNGPASERAVERGAWLLRLLRQRDLPEGGGHGG